MHLGNICRLRICWKGTTNFILLKRRTNEEQWSFYYHTRNNCILDINRILNMVPISTNIFFNKQILILCRCWNTTCIHHYMYNCMCHWQFIYFTVHFHCNTSLWNVNIISNHPVLHISMPITKSTRAMQPRRTAAQNATSTGDARGSSQLAPQLRVAHL